MCCIRMNFFPGLEPKFQTKFKEFVNSSKSFSRSLTNLSQATTPTPQEREMIIETPTNVQHQYRAFFNKATGKIEGLPPHMKELLKEGEISEGTSSTFLNLDVNCSKFIFKR